MLKLNSVDVRDNDLALDLGLSVAARAEELAEVLHVEAVDVDGALSVVLDDLVVGVASAAADDVRDAGGGAALDGERVLADVVPPDVLDRAAAVLTVDAFLLVLADDDVLHGPAGFDNEDGNRGARLVVARALHVVATL